MTHTILDKIFVDFFTTSETELDYYNQKVNVQAPSRVAERRKT